MASAAYNAWVKTVHDKGGRIAQSPSGKLTAAYDASAWVPKVNAGQWPLPDEYSLNGKIAYYMPPSYLANEIAQFGTATPGEIEAGGKQLMSQWHIPTAFQGLDQFFASLKSVAGIVLVVGAVYFVVKNRR